MTNSTIAVYENGVFKPTHPIEGLAEHAKVKLNFEPMPAFSPEEQMRRLAAMPVDEEFARAIEEGRKHPWSVDEF